MTLSSVHPRVLKVVYAVQLLSEFTLPHAQTAPGTSALDVGGAPLSETMEVGY